MGLPRAIIKKYGVTKKAWKVFRSKKKGSRTRTTTKRSVSRMAKRKIRRSYPKAKARSRKKSGGFGKLGKFVGAGIYGASREILSNQLAPLTSKIPLGTLSDEAGMFAVLWAGKKFLGRKIPLVNDIANAGMLIEAARIGAAVASGQVSLGSLGATSSGLNAGVIG